mgnify:CR=1 FL=1
MIKQNEKISRELNEILIERIRKYQTQDISQLLNSPNDGDTNNSYLGGLINFVGEDTNNLDDEINNDLDKITIDEIHIEPLPDSEYNNDIIEEEEEENEDPPPKGQVIDKKIKIIKKNNDKKGVDSNEAQKEENFPDVNIKDYTTNKAPEGIRVLLSDNLNNYFDLISKNYDKYDNNHFPKIIVNDSKTNTKKVLLANLRNKIFLTREGEKIIVNDDEYTTSLAYLKNREIYSDIPLNFKKNKSEFTLDFNLLDENIENIQLKSMEFIEINKLVSTSMSKIITYCSQLEKYIKNKLEPFDNSITISHEKVNRKKQIITEIKKRTLKNSGDIILKKIKMYNTIKLVNKLKKYIHLKNNMNNLETIISEPKNYQKTIDLINKCKEEIEKIKKENNEKEKGIQKFELKDEEDAKANNSMIQIFEDKLVEFRNENDNHISRQLSQLLNNYFNNFLIIENEEDVDKNKKWEQFEKYNISTFVLDKISSFSEKYNKLLTSINFLTPKEEMNKMSGFCDYYIENNLMSKIYNQLRGIFTTLSEEVMNNIISLFSDKVRDDDENEEIADTTNKNKETENKENQNKDTGENKDNDKNDNKDNKNKEDDTQNMGGNDNNEMCILLCVLISKNKLSEGITSFIEILLKKIENNEKLDKTIKENILKEIEEIKIIVKNNIKNIVINQIQKCLHIISSSNNVDLYINNFYLTLEMLESELPNYDIVSNSKENANNENDENNNENNDENNSVNNNELAKIIIEEQKYFIENWSKYILSKFDTEIFKTWDIIKEIPPRYQNILNVFFSFDINNNCMKDETIVTKFPSDKIKLIKEAEEEEEENTNNNSSSDIKENLLSIKDGEKPELKIKINQTSIEIIKFAFETLKIFTIFHKLCYGYILENFTKILASHLNFQTEQIYNGKCDFSISQQEICSTNCIFLLIEYIYDHIKDNDFLVTVAENCDQKISDNYLDLSGNINECLSLSKKKIEEFINNHCISEALNKLKEIVLPNYNVVSGDVPVNQYALNYISSLKDIYESMLNCYEDNFMREMISKALDNFFDKFEDYILHGKKIEDVNCLKQFRRDMVFLRKNFKFIEIIDLADLKNRIDSICKSVLPEYLRPKNK